MVSRVHIGCLTAVLGLATVAASQVERGDIDRTVAVIPAPVKAVWRCWTTSEGMASFLAKRSRIELRPGGAYELVLKPDNEPGKQGSEGCRVLCFVPYELLAFSWNAPPSIPRLRNAGKRTQVVLRFEPVGREATRVTLTQLGFGEGEDWEKYRAYFREAWPFVLHRLQARFKAPGEANPERAVADRPDRANRISRLVRRIERLEVELERQRREVEKLRAEVRRLKQKL